MSKLVTLFLMALLLSFALSNVGARASPVHPRDSSLISQDRNIETEESMMDTEDNCDGVGEDECLMRRTLQGRSDYIYTQSNNP
ncbi:hypothetical protein ACHQM5_018172 [Ranunculus cassubicifolius]